MKKILLSMMVGLFALASYQASAQVVCFVTNPQVVRGNYERGIAASGWGYDIDTVTAIGQLKVVRSVGGIAGGDSLACDTVIANASEIAGKIAVVYRGACEFGLKALTSQLNGAIGVIIINNAAGVLDLAGGTYGLRINIPVVLISNADGAALRPYIDDDSTVAIIGQKRGQFANDVGYPVGNIIRPIDFAVPATQVVNPGDYVFKLGANVTNYGQNPQTNLNLNVKIDFTDPSGAVSTVYNQNGTLAALAIDSTGLITVADYDPSGAGKGKYMITYEVTMANPDDFDGDNIVRQEFWITDSLFSKARIDSNTMVQRISGGVRPSDASSGPYEFGVWYYTGPHGHKMQVDDLSFSFVTNAGTNLINNTVVGKVSRWDDFNANEAIDPGELNEIGEGFYTYLDSLGSASVRVVPIENIATGQPGVRLDSNARYLISVAYTGTSDQVFTSIDPGMNYTSTRPFYNMQYISPVFVTTWNPNGFGPTRVPGIVAGISEPAGVSVENKLRNDLNIRVYPNPVRDELNIRMSADDHIGRVNYEVMDISGRVVLQGQEMVDGFSHQSQISVGQLQQGVYTLVLKTNKGFNTSRFVVSR
ncbi:MAG: PA domain-containing protein [Bacteroidia bacterium]